MYPVRAVLMLACLAPPVLGVTGKPAVLEQYVSTSWSRKDGLPSSLIHAITQTRDGYLWLGTSDGLVRFDGINFVHQRLFSDGNLLLGPVTAVCAEKDGALWVGSSSGVVMRISGALRQKYRLDTEVEALVEGPHGDVWTIAQNGIFLIKETPQGDLAVREQIDPKQLSRMLGSGTNGVSLGSTALVQTSGSFPVYAHRVTVGTETLFLNRDANGSGWLGTGPPWGDESIGVELQDRRGFLWTGRSNFGLLRRKAEDYQSETELGNDLVECLFEDREGDIWAGTNNRLFAFRFGKVSRMTARDGLSSDSVSSVEVTESTVWVGTQNSLNRIQNKRVEQYLRGLAVSIVKRAQEDQVWAATPKGVFAIYTAQEVAEPRHITTLSSVTAIEPGPPGCVWLLDAQKGLYLWKHGALRPTSSGWAAEGRKISAIRAGNDGALWVGFFDGGLGVYHDGSLKQISLAKLSVGTVYDIFVEKDVRGTHPLVWVGADTGLYRYDGQNVDLWNFDKGLPGDRVLWLQPEGKDILWLGFSTGVAKVHRTDLKSERELASYKVRCEFYDSGDGVFANVIRPSQSSAALDSEGKIWFTTSAGIAMIDASRIDINAVAPPVVIERVIADNREMRARSSIVFPALTKNLQIDYNGLSFVEPRKVQFRYRLDGFDKDWQEAGTRRQAIYTNLQPRSYRFQVKAANNDGVWNETGAILNFAVLPAFYQTRLFFILCALATIAIAWALYRVRLQQVHTALRNRFEERLAERTRIAQDLHDELLQSAMGVSLQIELTDAFVDERHTAKPHLERALMLSRNLLQKGREVLWDLRQKTISVNEISKRLTKTIEDLQCEGGAVARLTVEGQPRAVNPLLAEDLVQIGCEAIRNAFRHASATKVDVYLIYKEADLCLEVQDNGCGMDPRITDDGVPGHYGLIGMRERAERIGARLTMTSRAKEGTKVAVTVPGKHAYMGV